MAPSKNISLSVITGASRGIGRQICLDLAGKCAPGSSFLITSRNEEQLKTLKAEMKAANDNLKVWIVVCDMSDLNDQMKTAFDEVLREITEQSSYESLYLFHNAGFLGDVSKKALKLNETESWMTFMNANFIAMVLFNNIVLKWVTPIICKRRYIINMSSLLAVKAFPSFTQHACGKAARYLNYGKAAREAFFRGLAVEEPSLRVLNYCPGPVLTDMYLAVQEKSYDESIRKAYAVNKNENGAEAQGIHEQRLTPAQTVKVLLCVLEADKFDSGGRVDYFDEDLEDFRRN